MENKIMEYVDRKLIVYPKTEKMAAFRADLLSRMLNQYHSCKKMGMSDQKSYTLALAEMNHYSGPKAKAGNTRVSFCHLFEGIA